MTLQLFRRLVRPLCAGIAGLVMVSAADPAAARREREPRHDDGAPTRPAGPPLLAVVALGEQRVTIYDAQGRILRSPVSSGQTGYETPAGIYSIIQKNREHYSNLYDDAAMPFMQRITWSGIALHAGVLPGRPASHGCVRMPYAFAERIFDMTRMGMRVVVVPRDAAPVDFAHPALFRPQPVATGIAAVPAQPAAGDQPQKMRLGGAAPEPGVPATIPPRRAETLRSIAAAKAAELEAASKAADAARLAASRLTKEAARLVKSQRLVEVTKQRADAQLASAEEALAAADKERAEEAKEKALAKANEAKAQSEAVSAEAQAKNDAAERAREEAKTAEAARAAAAVAAREATARMAPVSVFISRQTGKLHVRQAFQPLFEAEVAIRDAEQPIGTHIFTALDYKDDGADVRWSALTMTRSRDGDEDIAERGGRRVRVAARHEEPAATDAAGAKAALDRITIPQETVDRISEVVSPGSSLIVSDEPISRETGKGTDFIVVMSGEPQGGIKIRRRPQPWGSSYERGYYGSRYRSPYGGGGLFQW